MNTVELFCGTKSFSKYAMSQGHNIFTVDIDKKFSPSLVHNLLKPFPKILKQKIGEADIIWMSPLCQTFSMASGNKHWTVDHKPKTKEAILGFKMLKLCLRISMKCERQDKLYFIENPRARARWFLPEYSRKTVWYCQYGDERAKPTDIWTNFIVWMPQICHNGNKNCHHKSAPRGSKTGTQGRKGVEERGKIPQKLFEEILKNQLNLKL